MYFCIQFTKRKKHELESADHEQATGAGREPLQKTGRPNGVSPRLRPSHLLSTFPTSSEQDSGVPAPWQHLCSQPADSFAGSGKRGAIIGRRRGTRTADNASRIAFHTCGRMRKHRERSLSGTRPRKSTIRTFRGKIHSHILQ